MPKRGSALYYSSGKRARFATARKRRSTYIRRPAIARAPATTRTRAPRAELKDHEGILAVASPIASGGTVSNSATLVPQGDDAHSRDGRVIYAKTINWRAIFESGLNTTGNTCGVVRFILFRWDDDTQPNVGDVITSPSVTAVYNLNNVFKLKVLQDRLIPINSYMFDSGGDAAPATTTASGSVPLGYQMGYDDTNGTQEKGGVYILYITNAGNWIQISCRTQLLYYDV